MTGMIRVLIADDHPVLRTGIRALLEAEADLEVVGEAGEGEEAVRQAGLTRPDVVIMDLEMVGMDGVEATRRTLAMNRDIRVLVLSMHAEEDRLLDVLNAGASGVVRKVDAGEKLLAAIRVVHRGELYLDPESQKVLLKRYRRLSNPEPDRLAVLTDREREVLALTAAGYSSREIGKQLRISPKTVDTYRARLSQKLGLSRRSELVHLALDTGLLVDDVESSARPLYANG
jgi:DNA-binding NarL/FixJ family response regulator